MAAKTMNDLFVRSLKDVYYAEKQINKALPKLIRQLSETGLKQALETHRGEVEDHIDRLEQVFEHCGTPPRSVRCEAIDGILQETREVIEEIEDDKVRDAALIADTQAAAHYLICRYGTLSAWAARLDLKEAQALLHQSLEEEKKIDHQLTEIAMQTVNKKAA